MENVTVKVKLTCSNTLKRKDGTFAANFIPKPNDPMNAQLPAANMVLQIPAGLEAQNAFIQGSDYIMELTLIQGE